MRRRPTRWAPVVLLLAASAIVGCERREMDPDVIAGDLHRYLEWHKEWEPVQRNAFEAVQDVERTYYVNDDYVARTFKSILPSIAEHTRELHGGKPRTYELQRVHERYVRAWRELETSMHAVVAAIDEKDYIELARHKNRMAMARAQVLATFEELDALLHSYQDEIDAITARKSAATMGNGDREAPDEESEAVETPKQL